MKYLSNQEKLFVCVVAIGFCCLYTNVFAQGPPSTKFVEVNGTNQLKHNDTLLVGGHINVKNLSGGKKPGDMLVAVDTDGNMKKIPFPPEKVFPGQGGNPNAGTCVAGPIWQNTGNDIYKCPTTGNVAIGNTDAQKKLHITTKHFTGFISCDTSVKPPQCLSHQGMRLEDILFDGLTGTQVSSEWDIEPIATLALRKLRIRTKGKTIMTLLENGKVNIGEQTIKSGSHQNGKFFVDGKIVAKDVVTTQVSWADDELKKDLTLEEDLVEEEKFKDKNGHLKGVKSGKIIEKEGINLAEMDATQMRLIERVFLYLFKFNKVVQELKRENKELKEELKKKDREFEKRISALEKKLK
ncbi:MAG: hypothetical protein FVQ77_11745 [Cytophagales bacterium]|nr:hypothetical protein [Cytophagales bacterium]